MLQEVQIQKLVHGGQALGTLPDGKKALVWNALPSETVRVRLTKNKNNYAEGFAEEVVVASPERIDPKDEAYLSTSPWQIMTWTAENKYKQEILHETFAREKVTVPKISFIAAGKAGPVRFSESEFISEGPMENPPGVFHYRNKMEYSFWADDEGLHLALFHRASHGKRIVPGSSIAMPEIDKTANQILDVLNAHGIHGSQLKTVVVRANQAGDTTAALFVKDEKFPKLAELDSLCKGIMVVYSNPKSPASVLTRELYRFGDTKLTDYILGTSITYDVPSFFQVNVPMFEAAAAELKQFVEHSGPVVDFYSGVGTIGVPVGATVLVESDANNIAMAKQNAKDQPIEIIHATAETALDSIPTGGTLIVDPPRAGLHQKVTERIRASKPNKIAYLSCNPATQARDMALLQDIYELKSLTGYNFFPRTPHIESLALLELRPQA